ncbi:MAG TPA: M48 family metallopeptidase [Acidimicrobiia bacterium]|nr:M48 family metallopeptidase [Acidimicrobiia bacterium]
MLEEIARNKRRSVVVIVLFVVVWAGIGALLGALFASSSSSPLGGIVAGVVIAAFIAVCCAVFAYSSGSRLVLAVSGAHPADGEQYRQLHNVVEEMAISAGLPKPAVYVIDDPSPNAFATGVSPNRAAITATTGLLEMMSRDELEGVISHEMSHIKNYDVRLILVVTTLIGFAALVASLAWRSVFFMRPRGRDSGQVALLVFAMAAVLALVAFVVGPLIRLALSRSREELADVSGVNLTRNPLGLMHALQKLEANDKPFASFNHATAAMCIDDPLQHHEAWFHHLFDTHPPLEERIAILQKISVGQAT